MILPLPFAWQDGTALRLIKHFGENDVVIRSKERINRL